MPQTMMAWFDSWWKVLTALFVLISGGVTAGISVAGYLSVPTQVSANETTLQNHEGRISSLERAREADRQALENGLVAVGDRLDRLECLIVASRRRTPIEDCL